MSCQLRDSPEFSTICMCYVQVIFVGVYLSKSEYFKLLLDTDHYRTWDVVRSYFEKSRCRYFR